MHPVSKGARGQSSGMAGVPLDRPVSLPLAAVLHLRGYAPEKAVAAGGTRSWSRWPPAWTRRSEMGLRGIHIRPLEGVTPLANWRKRC